MGYADYLKNLLHPLGVYDLIGGYGNAELEALGNAMDEANAEFQDILNSGSWNNATGDYLIMLEELLPIVNFAATEEERLKNVKILLNVNDSNNDKSSLERQLAACGIATDIVEADEKFTVELHFKNIRGELSDREEKVCRAIMPAHLILRFVCSGVTWDRIETLYPTWNDFDAAGLTASEMTKTE